MTAPLPPGTTRVTRFLLLLLVIPGLIACGSESGGPLVEGPQWSEMVDATAPILLTRYGDTHSHLPAKLRIDPRVGPSPEGDERSYRDPPDLESRRSYLRQVGLQETSYLLELNCRQAFTVPPEMDGDRWIVPEGCEEFVEQGTEGAAVVFSEPRRDGAEWLVFSRFVNHNGTWLVPFRLQWNDRWEVIETEPPRLIMYW